MNWKLILSLSLFGLAMAFATVLVIPSSIEPIFWLAIFLICAFLIARSRSTRHFLHGLMVGIVNCVWVTSAHIIFFDQYIATHPKEAAIMSSMPLRELATAHDGACRADRRDRFGYHYWLIGIRRRQAR